MQRKLFTIIICGLMIIYVIPSIKVSKSETEEDGAIMWYAWQSRLICIQVSYDGLSADFTESPLIQDNGDPMPDTAFVSLTMLEDGSLLFATEVGSTKPFVSRLFHIEDPQCDGNTSYAKFLGIMPDDIGIEALYTDALNRVYVMDTGQQHSSSLGNRLLRFKGDVLMGDFTYEVVNGLSKLVPDIDGLGPGINKTNGWVVDTPGFAIDSYDLYNVDYETGAFSFISTTDGSYATHAINGSHFSDGKSRLYTLTGIPQVGETSSTLYEINPDTGVTLRNLGSGPSGMGLTGSLAPGPGYFPDLKEPPIAIAGSDQTVNEGDTIQFDGSASYDPDGDHGVWVLKADIPSPTWGCGVTVLNGEIYYMGGIPCYPIVNPSSVFMKYYPTTDSWFNLTDLPAPRTYLGAAAANGKIYAIGGSNGNESTDTVFEFDPITYIWTPKSPMPNPMEAFGIAVVKDRIFVIGGSSTWLSNDSCRSVYEYDPANDSWSVKPDMPTGRSNLACAVLEDKIYAIGGNVYGPIGAVEVYDPSAETWTKRTNISIPRSGLSAEALGGNIYAFGGTNVWALPTNLTEVYDPSSDSGTIGPSMLEPRVYFGSGVVGTCIYAMGGSYGPLIVDLPDSTEEYCVGDGLVYEWDFDALVDSDGDGITTNDIDATGPTPTHVYGDDGNYTVTLTVIDEQGLSDKDTCSITVLNVNPAVKVESATMDVEIGLRVAGRKYNDVGMSLYENGNPISYVSIERMPGSPNEQMAWIPVTLDMTKSYSVTVTYTPEDPPNKGANPVWIYIKSKNGSINKIHHTFNVQQSKKRDSDHWNHVEPWQVDLNAHLIGNSFEITSHVTDPGSDDETLTYTYGSQVITVIHLNNPPNLDPYPSPEVKPMDIMDITTLVYGGTGTITLIVKDDDNIRLGIGQGSNSISIS